MTDKLTVKLLSDTPVSRDQFNGTHEDVAQAISDLVTNEDGGKTIGLEGGWGSGKSTIIRILQERLENSKIQTVVFDAWAHEGDPLRRSFLENLLIHLRTQKWIEQKEYARLYEKLTHRVRSSVVNSVPKLGRWSGLIAVSFLLVPIGVSLFNYGFNNSSLVAVILGLLFTVSPVVAVIILSLFTQEFDWTKVLSRKEDITTNSETIEEPNPTSIEFSKLFAEVMNTCLIADESRRIVLILDNLDRVILSDALSIFSSMQTFLHNSPYRTEPWFSRLWIIIPHDRTALEKLWQNGEKDGSVADSFLEKTYQNKQI